MMELTINDKNYEMKFGVRFIREMDKKYQLQQNGVEFGIGVVTALVQLQQGNPIILIDLIQAATATQTKLKESDIEKFLEGTADMDGLFNDFMEELGKQPLTKVTVDKMKKAAAK